MPPSASWFWGCYVLNIRTLSLYICTWLLSKSELTYSRTHIQMRERKKLEMCLAIKRYAAAATAKQEWKFFPFTFQYHPFYIAMAREWEERHHRNVKFSLSLSTVHTMFNIIMDRWCEVESKSEGGDVKLVRWRK